VRESVSNPIVLYDGVCGLCNRGVQFLLKRDRHDYLRYASLQSDFAAGLLKRHHVDVLELDTVYVVLEHRQANETLLARADAVAYLMRVIGGVWNVVRLVKLLPKWAQDRIYDLVARYRYRFFGKYETCPLPEERHRRRFLDLSVGD
jgi:predicted DCC family thiol-disulfide oxidoreductase YuxK